MTFSSMALTVSIILFLTGFMLLCDCPFWFGISALFAGLAMPQGTRKVRIYAAIFCVAAIGVAGMQIVELRKQQRARKIRQAEFELRGREAAGRAGDRGATNAIGIGERGGL